MNFLKRAFCSMRYRFRKGFLLVLAFSVAFFLVLTGFSMLQGADHSAETMRSRYRAAVGIYDFSTRSYSVRDQNLISAVTVEHLANHGTAPGSTGICHGEQLLARRGVFCRR